jgi:hypothetical protein
VGVGAGVGLGNGFLTVVTVLFEDSLLICDLSIYFLIKV